MNKANRKSSDIDSIVRIISKEVSGMRPALIENSWADTPFKVLISCILSLRTNDKTTGPASARLFKIADTPKKLAALPIKRIEKIIYPVGFYKTKAIRIRDIARTLIAEYDSKVPDTIDELLKLHGVGRKTANLVVTVGYNKPGICVDTHVHRISNRIGYVRTKTPEQTEFALRVKLPKKHWQAFNSLLVTWGQNVCHPTSPWCSKCRIRQYCRRIGVTHSR